MWSSLEWRLAQPVQERGPRRAAPPVLCGHDPGTSKPDRADPSIASICWMRARSAPPSPPGCHCGHHGLARRRSLRASARTFPTVDLVLCRALDRRQREVWHAIRDAKVDRPGAACCRGFGKWVLVDAAGRLLGRMAHAWQPPQEHAFRSGPAGAVVNWRKLDNKEEFHGNLRRDDWETILPELVFAPGQGGGHKKTLVAS